MQVLAEKLSELLDFHKDLVSLEQAAKVIFISCFQCCNFWAAQVALPLICINL